MLDTAIDTKPTIALAGNPNSGKTALFNALTGARQHVGNWPGVTVERKEGLASVDGASAVIIDLPGTYAFGSQALDESIARDFIVNHHPDIVINVVDTTHLERNLYLTLQILEMEVPVILALNMFDEAEAQNLEVHVDKLSEILGVEVVPTVAVQKRGTDKLVRKAIQAVSTAALEEDLAPRKLPLVDYGPTIEEEIKIIEDYLLEVVGNEIDRPLRWYALKLLENDFTIITELLADGDRHRQNSRAVRQLKTELKAAHSRIQDALGRQPVDLIAAARYDRAASIAHDVISRKTDTSGTTHSEIIDEVVLNRWLAYPIFLSVIWMMFKITFTLSEPLSELFVDFFEMLGTWVGGMLLAANIPQVIVDFVTDGIIAGVGAVLEFVPPIFLLFFVISILEDVGYMARAALLSDRLMRAVGLHGKAFIPMILGFGCNVTGILATRSLDSPRDRLISIMINPLISCAGRLPVYVLFATAFFKEKRGLVVFSLYVLGVVLAAAAAKVLSIFMEPDASSTFVMELPPYRLPRPMAVLIQTWERGKEFLNKAGTIILAAVAIVWVLANMPPGTGPGSPHSYIGRIGTVIAPIFRPAGFGTWEAVVALIFGIVAKELIIGTLGVLYGASNATLIQAIQGAWTPLSAYAFLVMSLVYAPCVATIAAIRRETSSWKWTALSVSYTLVLGWLLAVLVYQLGGLLGLS